MSRWSSNWSDTLSGWKVGVWKNAMASTLPPGEPFALDGLVTPTAQGIASRVLARTAAGNITLLPSMRVKNYQSTPRRLTRSS